LKCHNGQDWDGRNLNQPIASCDGDPFHARAHAREPIDMGCVSSREYDGSPQPHRQHKGTKGGSHKKKFANTHLPLSHNVPANVSPSSPTWWAHGGPPPLFHFSAAANKAQARDVLTYGRGAGADLASLAGKPPAAYESDGGHDEGAEATWRPNGDGWIREGPTSEWSADEIDGERERSLTDRTVSRIKTSVDSGLDTGSHRTSDGADDHDYDGLHPTTPVVYAQARFVTATQHEYYGDAGCRPMSEHLYAVCRDSIPDEGIAKPVISVYYEEIDEEGTSPTPFYALALSTPASHHPSATVGHDYRTAAEVSDQQGPKQPPAPIEHDYCVMALPAVARNGEWNPFYQAHDYRTIEP
jgi:hypothetical protein